METNLVGMTPAYNRVDMVGKRIGRLVIISAHKSQHNRARWVARCDCGNTCIVTGKSVREGKKKSCGCWFDAIFRPTSVDDSAACAFLMKRYQLEATRRGHEFVLNLEQFKSITSRNCFYCGVEPLQKIDNYAVPYIYNGIDRQDNLLGYNVHNCVACCKFCNASKGTLTVQEFLEKCRRVISYQNSKKSAEMTDSACKSE